MQCDACVGFGSREGTIGKGLRKRFGCASALVIARPRSAEIVLPRALKPQKKSCTHARESVR
jgi:hypothetical protein